MIEEWRPVPGYEGMYSVSNFGGFRSEERIEDTTGRFGKMKRRRNAMVKRPNLCGGNGKYFAYELWKNGELKKVQIHRLVYSVFIGELKKGYHIHHKDEDPSNNRIDNLEQIEKRIHGSMHSHPAWNRKKIRCIETGEVFETIKSMKQSVGSSENMNIRPIILSKKSLRGSRMNMSEKKIPAETWDRTCGYFRPVNQMHKGKQQEVSDRARYNPNRIAEDCSEYI